MARRSKSASVQKRGYAVITTTNNTLRRDGLDRLVLRREYFLTEAAAITRVQQYETGITPVKPTATEYASVALYDNGMHPWNDGIGDETGRDYYAFWSSVYPVALDPMNGSHVYGPAVYRSVEIHEYA